MIDKKIIKELAESECPSNYLFKNSEKAKKYFSDDSKKDKEKTEKERLIQNIMQVFGVSEVKARKWFNKLDKELRKHKKIKK